MLRQSYTAVIERNVWCEGGWATEPYEAAWALEAILFVRVLERRNIERPVSFRVQVSPDGIHWCDEGSELVIDPQNDLSFVRVGHFGGWLRLRGELSADEGLKVIVYVTLKG